MINEKLKPKEIRRLLIPHSYLLNFGLCLLCAYIDFVRLFHGTDCFLQKRRDGKKEWKQRHECKMHNDSHGGKNKNKIIFIYLLGREILYGRKKNSLCKNPHSHQQVYLWWLLWWRRDWCMNSRSLRWSHKLSREYIKSWQILYFFLKSRDKSLKQSTETMQFYILWNFVGTPKKRWRLFIFRDTCTVYVQEQITVSQCTSLGAEKQTTGGGADNKLKSPDKMSRASSVSILGCGRRQSKA